ncbi:MAG: Gamma-glutamyl ligase family protein [Parcubacteria group bacterium]|nr:Gamma-glutamyl ligase family protein [Parcubacteria group bacterium]
MEFIPIKTRRFEPPKDDLFEVLDTTLPALQEEDIVAIASKVVAIHEGRCVQVTDEEGRQRLIKEESDSIIPTSTPGAWDLTIKNDMVAFAGGIDESNAGGFIVLLPEHPQESAARIRDYLRTKHHIKRLGIVITDSSALPFRQGVIALSIGHAGFAPVNDRTGISDLFGRAFKYTYINVVDALAISAGFVMGETDESTPLCIIRSAPFVEFTDEDRSDTLRIRPEDDVFYPLFKDKNDKADS